jgi:hypothetical protein
MADVETMIKLFSLSPNSFLELLPSELLLLIRGTYNGPTCKIPLLSPTFCIDLARHYHVDGEGSAWFSIRNICMRCLKRRREIDIHLFTCKCKVCSLKYFLVCRKCFLEENAKLQENEICYLFTSDMVTKHLELPYPPKSWFHIL